MQTEPELTRSVLKELKKQGARPVKIVGCESQEAGVSDILACTGGRFLAIEMKRADLKHKVSALQALFLDDIERCGGYAAVCTSVAGAVEAERAARAGDRSRWREECDARAFPRRDRSFASRSMNNQ